TNRPVALICTSGTAAANYFPAVVEAYYSQVPLIILTADRPHELRGIGAPQAIDQIELYGNYPKWFHEMALPDSTEESLQYARSKASRAFSLSKMENAGPVHLNFPLREPLTPDFSLENLWGTTQNYAYHPVYNGAKRLTENMLSFLFEKIHSKKRGLLVCGPQIDTGLAHAVTELAHAWGLPIIADPLSQIRSGYHNKENIIEGYDTFLRDETIREKLAPDFIIRFGAMPVSKAYLFYVQEHRGVDQFIVEAGERHRDHSGVNSEFIYADPTLFCEDALRFIPKRSNIDENWLIQWQKMNKTTKKYLQAESEDRVTEGEAVRGLLEVIPEQSYIYVGNSMAVRDLDTFLTTTDKDIRILANRGANGIDGMVSSGLGAAANAEHPVKLMLRDLCFFHDFNGLRASKHYDFNLTVLLINNDGGGIFSFLPQAKNGKYFEELFGTPLGIEFKQGIEMYGGTYH